MPPNGTPQQIADYLVRGYHDDNYYGLKVRFDPDRTGPIRVDVSGLDAEGQQLALWAIEAWETAADVSFEVVSSGAELVFDDEGNGATAHYDTFLDGTIHSARLNIGKGWLKTHGHAIDSYSFRTYMHEIGHVLGLGHPGNYDDGQSGYERDALFGNDSWQISVMSYFNQKENPTISGSWASNITPMQADLLAVREIYGEAPSHFADGDTVWGVGSNIDTYLGDFFRSMGKPDPDIRQGNSVTFYVEDRDGHDLIDLSHVGHGQKIDLRGGQMSDVLGATGNMLLARGTVIEDVASGGGADRIIGNAANNRILAGGQADTVRAGKGADVVFGGNGHDRLFGQDGNDQLRGNAHGDLLNGGGGDDRLAGGPGKDTLLGGAGRDRLSGGDHSDRLVGHQGHDILSGGPGNDLLVGKQGRDVLLGGPGRDTLRGGSARDVLRGQEGNDRLTGGGGPDFYVFEHGIDRITDFQDDIDTIRIKAAAAGHPDLDMAGLFEMARVIDGNLVFTFGTETQLLVEGIEDATLLANDIQIF